jgi:hypothetical protein
MNIQEYFDKSTGSFPDSRCTGVESEWMRVGTLSAPCGDLWAGVCFTDPEEGCVVKVPVGVHEVWIKGMDFKGHRRTARVRVCPTSFQETALADRCGEICVDGGLIFLCDIGAFEEVVTGRYEKQFQKEFVEASSAAYFESYGIRCMSFNYDGRSIDVGHMPAGLGDGTYPVFPLMCQNQMVGLEVEFLPLNYITPLLV